PYSIAMENGCLAFCPLIAFHSKKPSTGTIQRRRAYASRNVGNREMVSAFALIGLRPPLGSLHQYGIRPHFRKSSDRSPVRGFWRIMSSSWQGAPLYLRGAFVSRLSRTSSPSTIARLRGPDA